jgi:chromosomal replication initiation ATPase DnaA
MRAFLDREIAAEVAPLMRGRASLRAVELAAGLYGVTTEDILSGGSSHQLARARHASAWLLRREGWSYRNIATALGYADHSSPLLACRRIDGDLATRALLREIEVA